VKMQARTLVKRRLRELKPIARELGCAEALAGIDRILDKGTGAERQEQVWNANRDVTEVASELAAASEDV
jgi:gamma-glutamyl:cysteine ligase YbdK (ATP-grasp superfamily)